MNYSKQYSNVNRSVTQSRDVVKTHVISVDSRPRSRGQRLTTMLLCWLLAVCLYVCTIDILGPRLPTHTWRGRHMYEESKMASSTGQKTRELYYEK